MAAASQLALLACGVFFLTGLLTGVWKYLATSRSAQSEAPRYVKVAHQTSLMYSFAALVLLEFVKFSPYSETVNSIAVAVPLFFFAVAITTYISLITTSWVVLGPISSRASNHDIVCYFV